MITLNLTGHTGLGWGGGQARKDVGQWQDTGWPSCGCINFPLTASDGRGVCCSIGTSCVHLEAKLCSFSLFIFLLLPRPKQTCTRCTLAIFIVFFLPRTWKEKGYFKIRETWFRYKLTGIYVADYFMWMWIMYIFIILKITSRSVKYHGCKWSFRFSLETFL